MMEQLDPLTLLVEIEGNKNIDTTELDGLTRSLLEEIEQDIPVRAVELAAARAPDDTRSQEAITLGVITITLLPVFVDKLIDLLTSWVERNETPKVTLTIPAQRGQIAVEYYPGKSTRKEIKKVIMEALKTAKAGDT